MHRWATNGCALFLYASVRVVYLSGQTLRAAITAASLPLTVITPLTRVMLVISSAVTLRPAPPSSPARKIELFLEIWKIMLHLMVSFYGGYICQGRRWRKFITFPAGAWAARFVSAPAMALSFRSKLL